LDECTVYLVPIGSGRFDLYNESAEDDDDAERPLSEGDGFWMRRSRQLQNTWRQISRSASAAPGAEVGRLVRMRNWLVRRIAESIAEQRTLWSLRGMVSASFVYPSDLPEASAATIRERLLAHAGRHHRLWFVINLLGVGVTLALALLPGPNLIGYYFAFRLVGHFLSWRGAVHALEKVTWHPQQEPALAELGSLATLGAEERGARVAAIAARLGLCRLQLFFDRVACGSA
jgi:K+-H+ exchange-related protein